MGASHFKVQIKREFVDSHSKHLGERDRAHNTHEIADSPKR